MERIKRELKARFGTRFSLRTYRGIETVHINWTRESNFVRIADVEQLLRDLEVHGRFSLNHFDGNEKLVIL